MDETDWPHNWPLTFTWQRGKMYFFSLQLRRTWVSACKKYILYGILVLLRNWQNKQVWVTPTSNIFSDFRNGPLLPSGVLYHTSSLIFKLSLTGHPGLLYSLPHTHTNTRFTWLLSFFCSLQRSILLCQLRSLLEVSNRVQHTMQKSATAAAALVQVTTVNPNKRPIINKHQTPWHFCQTNKKKKKEQRSSECLGRR